MIQEDAHEGMPLLQGMLRLYDDFHSRLAPLGGQDKQYHSREADQSFTE